MQGVHKMMRALHFIAWLESHTEYAETAVVLAEYVAKTALLSSLPPETSHKYTALLDRMGIRVGKLNNETLAKCAMGLALPAIKSVFEGGHKSDTSVLTALVDAMSIAQDIMHRIHDVANTEPAAIKQESHNEMANFIRANFQNTAVSTEDFEKAAKSAYGKTAHWLAMAIPSIDVTGDVGKQLERAYAECNEWAKSKIARTKYHPEVTAIVHDTILKNSLGLHSGKTLHSANTCALPSENDTSRSPETKLLKAQADDRHCLHEKQKR
jgi:hypothetical protein